MTKSKKGTINCLNVKELKRRKICGKGKLCLYAALLLFALGSCSEPGDVGMELLPTTDLIKVGSVVDKNIQAYTFQEGNVRSDEAPKSLLGSMNDPTFGKISIDLATQFRIQSFPSKFKNATADSVVLYLYYRNVYGDTSTVQKLKVYELQQSISIDDSSYTHDDLSKLASPVLLGEKQFKPKVARDSTTRDTLYQLLSIKLDNSLASKLITADSLDMINSDVFLNYFKGLYVQAEQVQQTGAIISLELQSSSSFQGSALVLYYRNNTDTLNYAYRCTSFSARLNSAKHDYSQTAFYPNLNKETVTDSLIYIQPLGGLESKVYIPGLERWRDSTNIAINKAEIIFQVDTTTSNYRKFPLPSQLFLTVVKGDERPRPPADYYFYPLYYGGYLRSDYAYHFNITQHLEEIIKGKTENQGFYLTTAQKNSQVNRVVLKGSTSKVGIKMVVTYSKFFQ